MLLCGFPYYRTHPRFCVYKYFVQLWSRLIEKCGLYCANKVQKQQFSIFLGNNPGVTGQILLIIELICNLVPIKTSCKFGPDWLRNVVSIALTRKELTDARAHARRTNCHDISPSGLWPVELKSLGDTVVIPLSALNTRLLCAHFFSCILRGAYYILLLKMGGVLVELLMWRRCLSDVNQWDTCNKYPQHICHLAYEIILKIILFILSRSEQWDPVMTEAEGIIWKITSLCLKNLASLTSSSKPV